MKKTLIIIKKEYLERVKSLGFLISTFLIPVILGATFAIPILLAVFGGDSKNNVAVIDQTGKVQPLLIQQLAADTADKYLSLVPAANSNTARATLTAEIERGNLAGYVLIENSGNDTNNIKATFFGKSVSNVRLNRTLERAIEKSLTTLRLTEAGLDRQRIAGIEKPFDMTTSKISGEGKTKKDSGEGRFFLSYAMAMLIYGTVLGYGVMVMSAVIEEKNSKIMEVMISSVKPVELMLGKIIGVGLVAFTQYAIWSVALLVFSALTISSAASAGALPINVDIPPSLIAYFILYFLFGYFIFSTLYAAIGSTVENANDAQSLSTPVTFLVIIPVLTLSLVATQPESTVAIVLSLIPFFSPILMMARLAAVEVPLWQVALSFALMSITLYGIVTLAAKIYRVGVLMYGKKPGIGEVIKWLRYS